jgi:hypothetical protein
MKQIFCLAMLISGSILSQNDSHDRFDNLDKFGSAIHTLNDSLGKKYRISQLAFDVECISNAADLSKLIADILKLGEMPSKFIKDGLDESNKQYYTIYEVAANRYEFRTTTESDYVELENTFQTLELITKKNKPDHQYNFSNADGGQIAYMIFASNDQLKKAVDEGYPCSLPDGQWRWEKQWKWGVYSDITLDSLPDLGELKVKYHQTLSDLHQRGYNVPALTIQRIHIDDILNKQSIDIVIDGGPMITSSNPFAGGKVRCFWESWGVLLAYTLVKHYQGRPTLYDKEEKKTTSLTPQEYIDKAESAFGSRK